MPGRDVVFMYTPGQGLMTVSAFFKRHGDGLVERVCHLVNIVRVNDECLMHFFGRTCKLGQDKHARLRLVLRSHILLGQKDSCHHARG